MPDPDPATAAFARFRQTRGEADFAAVVADGAPFVRAVARRVVGPDHALAEDVVQQVFTDLALRPGRVPAGACLRAWLHRHTFFTASKAIRSEIRRRHRETTAARERGTHSPPIAHSPLQLDAALASLPAAEREILALRFGADVSWREIAERTGLSPDAARKRGDRALDRLRRRLGKFASAALVAAYTETSASPADRALGPRLLQQIRSRPPRGWLFGAAAFVAIGLVLWSLPAALRPEASGRAASAPPPPPQMSLGRSRVLLDVILVPETTLLRELATDFPTPERQTTLFAALNARHDATAHHFALPLRESGAALVSETTPFVFPSAFSTRGEPTQEATQDVGTRARVAVSHDPTTGRVVGRLELEHDFAPPTLRKWPLALDELAAGPASPAISLFTFHRLECRAAAALVPGRPSLAFATQLSPEGTLGERPAACFVFLTLEGGVTGPARNTPLRWQRHEIISVPTTSVVPSLTSTPPTSDAQLHAMATKEPTSQLVAFSLQCSADPSSVTETRAEQAYPTEFTSDPEHFALPVQSIERRHFGTQVRWDGPSVDVGFTALAAQQPWPVLSVTDNRRGHVDVPVVVTHRAGGAAVGPQPRLVALTPTPTPRAGAAAETWLTFASSESVDEAPPAPAADDLRTLVLGFRVPSAAADALPTGDAGLFRTLSAQGSTALVFAAGAPLAAGETALTSGFEWISPQEWKPFPETFQTATLSSQLELHATQEPGGGWRLDVRGDLAPAASTLDFPYHGLGSETDVTRLQTSVSAQAEPRLLATLADPPAAAGDDSPQTTFVFLLVPGLGSAGPVPVLLDASVVELAPGDATAEEALARQQPVATATVAVADGASFSLAREVAVPTSVTYRRGDTGQPWLDRFPDSEATLFDWMGKVTAATITEVTLADMRLAFMFDRSAPPTSEDVDRALGNGREATLRLPLHGVRFTTSSLALPVDEWTSAGVETASSRRFALLLRPRRG